MSWERWFPERTQYLWFCEYGTTTPAHARNDRGQALCDARLYIPPFKAPGLPLPNMYDRHAEPCPRCKLIINAQEGR